MRYIIIGSTRCGTTSLYNYISAHPQAKAAKGSGFREVHFFDYPQNFDRGIDWYRSQFPNAQVTGETSPTYLQHPLVPVRIHKHCPDVKLIALLRNPVDRAWSDYHLALKKGWTKETFKQRIDKEQRELESERCLELWTKKFYLSKTHLLGFLERGKYAQQLERWFDVLPKENFLILFSEKFYRHPQNVLNRVYIFLGLEPKNLAKYRKWHSGKYGQMSTRMRQQLEKFFKPHNERLEGLLRRKIEW